MIQKQDILIMFFRDGKSQRAIERETGISRKTISKYIKEYEEQKRLLLETNPLVDIQELTDSIVAAPRYDSSNREKRKVTEEVVKARYELGDVCEFDWGEVKLTIAGKLIKVQIAIFTSAAGNYRYALLFLKQDTACFLESHSQFFEHLAKYIRLWYTTTLEWQLSDSLEQKVNQPKLYSNFHCITVSSSGFAMSIQGMKSHTWNVV